ncbi:hypothetical protein [Roseicyclus sp.]|uniref:hypothetical protein n=1 Tax=Roseicyclus sp. TaxID=1914329 RepID=UPI001BCF9F82|nr:hypothetical protein [Roseicyclus sp.]
MGAPFSFVCGASKRKAPPELPQGVRPEPLLFIVPSEDMHASAAKALNINLIHGWCSLGKGSSAASAKGCLRAAGNDLFAVSFILLSHTFLPRCGQRGILHGALTKT